MSNLLERENLNKIITLGNKARISDPCYDIDTWCAGTLENVLPGNYQCFLQRVDEESWGVRIANIEVRHKDYLHIEPTELQSIDVGVDSGQCGIYDLDYFVKAREDKYGEDEWYDRVCNMTDEYISNPNYVPFNKSSFWKEEFEKVEFIMNAMEDKMDSLYAGLVLLKAALNKTDDLTEEERKYLEEKKDKTKDLSWELEHEYYKAKEQYRHSKESLERIFRFTANTLDDKCLVSSSGDGDGNYSCFVGRNKEGQIVSIKIDYYYNPYGDEDEDYEDDEDNE